LAREHPTSLVWVRTGRPLPPLAGGGELIFLDAVCASPASAGVSWFCDPRGCRLSMSVGYPSAAIARAHRPEAHIQQALKDPSRARSVVIGDALALIEHSCGQDRCADDVLHAAAQLRAAAGQPPWDLDEDNEGIRLYAPAPSNDYLRCDRGVPGGGLRECQLQIGRLSYREDPRSNSESLSEGLPSTWSLGADPSGLLLEESAVR
jgi:hypothetical protein